jgi:hypothetical protein
MVDGFDFFGLLIDTMKTADCVIQLDFLEIQMKKGRGDFVRNGIYHFQKTSRRMNENENINNTVFVWGSHMYYREYYVDCPLSKSMEKLLALQIL